MFTKCVQLNAVLTIMGVSRTFTDIFRQRRHWVFSSTKSLCQLVSFDLIQAIGHVLQKTERMQNNILQNLAQPLWRNLKISYLKNITVTKLLQFNKSSLLTTFITCLSRLAESWQTCLYLTCTLNINMLNININTAIFASSIHMKASAMNELPEIEYPCFSQRVNDRGVNIASHQRKSKAKSVILNGFG